MRVLLLDLSADELRAAGSTLTQFFSGAGVTLAPAVVNALAAAPAPAPPVLPVPAAAPLRRRRAIAPASAAAVAENAAAPARPGSMKECVLAFVQAAPRRKSEVLEHVQAAGFDPTPESLYQCLWGLGKQNVLRYDSERDVWRKA